MILFSEIFNLFFPSISLLVLILSKLEMIISDFIILLLTLIASTLLSFMIISSTSELFLIFTPKSFANCNKALMSS